MIRLRSALLVLLTALETLTGVGLTAWEASSAMEKPLIIRVFRGKSKVKVQPPAGLSAERVFQQEVLCRQRAELMVRQRAAEYEATAMTRFPQAMADFEYGEEMLFCLENLGYRTDQP